MIVVNEGRNGKNEKGEKRRNNEGVSMVRRSQRIEEKVRYKEKDEEGSWG